MRSVVLESGKKEKEIGRKKRRRQGEKKYMYKALDELIQGIRISNV